MTMASLLIVDAVARRRRLLEVGLRRAGYRVTVAGEPQQALWFLQHSLPDVIVSAFAFQSTDGEHLARVLRSRPDAAHVALVMLLGDAGDEAQASGWADATIREPVLLREVTERVQQVLWRRRIAAFSDGARSSLAGSLRDVTAVDLLCLAERRRMTGVLEVETSRRAATLWLREGEVVDGEFGEFAGEEAVLRLIAVEDGSFELTDRPVAQVKVIEASTSGLVAEGLRRIDEWIRLCAEMPAMSSALRVDREVLGAQRSDLPAEQIALIQRFDGRRTIEEVIEQSGQDPLLTLEVLRNLYSAGLLIVADSAAAASSVDRGVMLGAEEEGFGELPPLPQPFPSFEGGAPDEEMELVSGIPEDHAHEPTVTPASSVVNPAITEAVAVAVAVVERSPPASSAGVLSSLVAEKPAPLGRVGAPVFALAKSPTPGAGLRAPPSAPGARFPFTAVKRPEPAQPASPEPASRSGSAEEGRKKYRAARGRVDSRETIHPGDRGIVGGELMVQASAQRGADEQAFTQRLGLPRILVHRVEWRRDSTPEPVQMIARSRDESPTGSSAAGELSVTSASRRRRIARFAGDPSDPRRERPMQGPAGEVAARPAGASAQVGADAAAPSARGLMGWGADDPEDGPLVPASAEDMGRLNALAEVLVGRSQAVPKDIAEGAGRLPVPVPAPERALPSGRILLVIGGVVIAAWFVAVRLVGGDPEAAVKPPAGAHSAATTEAATTKAVRPQGAAGSGAEASAEGERVAAERAAAEQAAALKIVGEAEALYQNAKIGEASLEVARALARDPSCAPALVLRAKIWLDQGEPARAHDAAQAAIAADAGLADAWLTLGVVEEERAAIPAAVAAYERYLELTPKGQYAASVRRRLLALRRVKPTSGP
jgi:CheY-like chemotaxis protein